ncbi:MAG: integrase [Neptuniibacter pectenicola]|jgi:integrase|uniref:hypothetical protein n=1 Tax=Neptuniibacter pectenicola TaxID=1806669 RepID=UPI003AE0659F|tara:strand:- start:4084 stop:4320 length:237 start_codon:yes stop_codon:yes gene_type:complete
MYKYLEKVGTSPVNRAAAKLLLLTMVRKSELSQAKWSEINFSEALWSIPKERMKCANGRIVGHFRCVPCYDHLELYKK